MLGKVKPFEVESKQRRHAVLSPTEHHSLDLLSFKQYVYKGVNS